MNGRFTFSVFGFDAETAELTRNGRRLPLPEQPARVLTVLLQRAGKLVTREELQSQIWPNGEFLDHYNAMNKAVHQLRMILRDNPNSPHFIETIPKRGYRFRGPVTLLPASPPMSSMDTTLEENPQEDRHLSPVMSMPEFDQARSEESDPIDIDPAPTVITDRDQHWLPHRYWKAWHWNRKLQWISGLSVLCFLVTTVALFVILRKAYPVHEANAQYLSMGVPPFEIKGAGAEQLGESFRLDLTDALSQLPEIRMQAARSLVNQPLNNGNIPVLSKTLHLDVLLLGKFTLQGTNFILQLELMRGSDATHLASFEYSGSEDQLATIRDKAQHDIFTRLALTKNPTDSITSTANPHAYKSYLIARDYASSRTPQSLEKALQQYQDAISSDPTFARAYAGMATAYMAISNKDPSTSRDAEDTDIQKAAEFATKALQLDPMLAEPHAVLGNVAYIQNWDIPLAEKELRRAIELDPHQAVYHLWLAFVLTDEGRFDESFAQIDLAQSADPLWAIPYSDECFVALSAHDNARAIAAAQKYRKLDPNPSHPGGVNQLGWAFFLAGHYEEAIAQWRLAATMEKDTALITLEDQGLEAFRREGVSAYVQVLLRAYESGFRISPANKNDFVPSEWYAYAGNRDKAIVLLQEMIRHHDPLVIDLAVNPMYDNLHDDPRFLAILSQVGLSIPDSYAKSKMRASLR